MNDIREFVARIARQGGFSEKEIYSLQLAADEAATNIIEHACADLPNANFDVTCEMRGNTLMIIMHDMGAPFDPAAIQPPNLTADLSARKIGGLGLYLMHKLMDEVHYTPNSKTGNVLTMLKHRG